MPPGGGWIRTTTRWAIHLRDNFRCLYCFCDMEQALEDGVFMVLDHVKHHHKGGSNKPRNLMTACYDCNRQRGRKSLRQTASEMELNYSTLRARVYKRRQRELRDYREAARVLLGSVSGTKSDLVARHEFQVKRQWMQQSEVDMWNYYKGTMPLDDGVPF